MKTLEEIKNEVAVNHGFDEWEIYYFNRAKGSKIDLMVTEVAEEYAKQCCDEQKLQCADNAKVIAGNLLERTPDNKHFWNMKHNLFVEADRESILNTPNVVTTKT